MIYSLSVRLRLQRCLAAHSDRCVWWCEGGELTQKRRHQGGALLTLVCVQRATRRFPQALHYSTPRHSMSKAMNQTAAKHRQEPWHGMSHQPISNRASDSQGLPSATRCQSWCTVTPYLSLKSAADVDLADASAYRSYTQTRYSSYESPAFPDSEAVCTEGRLLAVCHQAASLGHSCRGRKYRLSTLSKPYIHSQYHACANVAYIPLHSAIL